MMKKRYRFAFWLALATAAATFCLIVLGGVVFNTGSSLACPDWPKCYDQWMPPMKGGILYEHSHRLLGAFVGLCSLLLCGALWRREPGIPSLRWAGVLIPLMVIFQGVLGGIIVIYKLPMLVRAGHLAMSMVVLMTLIYIARASYVRARGLDVAALPLSASPGIRAAFPLLVVAASLVYIQMILGALVRHTNSSEAAGWGLAYSMIGVDPLTGNYSLWPGDEAAQLNVFHRYLALFVASVVMVCCGRVWSLVREHLDFRKSVLAWLPVALVLLQILIGVTMLATWNLKIYPTLSITDAEANLVQVIMRTLHLAVGTALLASLCWMAIEAGQSARAQEVLMAKPVRPSGGELQTA